MSYTTSTTTLKYFKLGSVQNKHVSNWSSWSAVYYTYISILLSERCLIFAVVLIWPTSHISESTVFSDWRTFYPVSTATPTTTVWTLETVFTFTRLLFGTIYNVATYCSLGLFQIGTKTLIAFAILLLQCEYSEFYSHMGLPLYRCHSRLNYNPLFKRVKFSKYHKTKRTLVRANLVCYHFGLVVTYYWT